MTTTHGVAILAIIALCACGPDPAGRGLGGLGIVRHAPGDELTPPPVVPTCALGISAAAPSGAYTSVDRYELFSTNQVYLVADFANVSASQAERLDLYAPSGSLWYATLITFNGATGSDRAVVVLPDGTTRVTYLLEVAGTPIETFNMTGTWRVTVTLDGTTTSTSRTFELY